MSETEETSAASKLAGNPVAHGVALKANGALLNVMSGMKSRKYHGES
jgi:hypothetical protein